MFPYSKRNTVNNHLEEIQEEFLQEADVFPLDFSSYKTSSSLFPGPYGSHPQSLPPPTAAPVQDINQFGDYGSYCMLLPPPTPSSFNPQPYLTLAVSASNILLSSPHHSLFSRFAIRSGFLNLIFFFYPDEALHQAIPSSNLSSLQSSQ